MPTPILPAAGAIPTQQGELPAHAVDVLVIGTGPAGATAALGLAKAGVSVTMVNRYGWTCRTPRAHLLNPRSLEVLADLGVMEGVRAYATPTELLAENVICTSLAGAEFGRIRTWGNDPARRFAYAVHSPETYVDLPQNYLENILVSAAAHHGANVLFSTELVSFEQDEEGVTSILHNKLTGTNLRVRSKYLIGADGARSMVAERLGLPFAGEMDKMGATNILFEADLSRYASNRPSSLYWMLQPGEAGGVESGTLRMVRPWTRWLGTTAYDLNNPIDLTDDLARKLMQRLIGDDSVDIRIISTALWSFNECWATRLHQGRVFCAGDAIHRHPPTKALGATTCLQDSYNLAWKLALVLKGLAGRDLLETYTAERGPVAAHFVPAAYRCAERFIPIAMAINPTGAQAPAEIESEIATLRSTAPEAAERRAKIVEAIADTYITYDCPGIEMNQRYSAGAIAVPEGELEPPLLGDPEVDYSATSFPGARLPHVWLSKDQRKVSSLYVCGDGAFTLLTGNSGAGWREIAQTVGETLGLAIRVIVVGPGQDYEDTYGDFQRRREVAEDGAILVRPDVYVGWRAQSLRPDSAQALERALRTILHR
ncbi:MAG: FAD-dependent monooxygenase [Pseudomonadota bacterium]|jgi:2,4-dichlorophenol 6-monooxygenase